MTPMKRFLSLVLLALASCAPAEAATTLAGNLVVQNSITQQGFLSPAQVTADQNNYAPANFATAAALRITTDANRTITGLAGGASGRVVAIYNIGSFNLVLANESASSTAANRFATGSDVTLTPDTGVVLQYDATTLRWRAQGAPSSGGGGGGVTSITAGTGISVDQSTGVVTITNTGGGGGTAWGQITGNLGDQTDLQGVLDSKVYISALPTYLVWGAIGGSLDDQTDLTSVLTDLGNQIVDRAPKGPISSSGLSIDPAKLAGRSTAGAGDIEEIGIGDGLTLNAGVLSATATGGGPTVVTAAYSATLATDASQAPSGGLLVVQVGALTGDITLSNPTNPTNRQRLEFVLVQDSTGGRALTFGNKFRFPSSSSLTSPVNSGNSSDFVTASKQTLVMAEYDEALDVWNIVGFIPGY